MTVRVSSTAAGSRPSSRGALRRFAALPAGERRHVARCCVLLARAALLARMRPIDHVVAAIDARAARRPRAGAVGAERAVQLLAAVAARLRPRPRCLSTALAGYELLRERGVAARCVIGGRRGGSAFEAHAWVEADGRVLLGAPVTAYRALWQWPSR